MDKKTRQRIETFLETIEARAQALEAIQLEQPAKDSVQREASALGVVALDMEEWLDEDRRREKRAFRMSLIRGLLAFFVLAGLLAANVYVFHENSLTEDGDYLKVIRQFFPELSDPATWAEYLKLAVAGGLGLMSFLSSLIVAMFLEVFLKAVRLPMNALIFSILAAGVSTVILYYYLGYFDVLKETLYRFV
ncbi:MAG: hypothetical protein ACOCWR_04390 [Oceanidesulfovibrio sp.]